MSEKKPDKAHRTRAGQLLSKWLRQIAEEETEFVKDDNGEDRMVTKAEAIARLMWKIALGYTVEERNDDGTITKTHYAPNRAMMNLLLDRIEGRAPVSTEMGKKKQSVADKISEQGAKRIKDAGGVDVTG